MTDYIINVFLSWSSWFLVLTVLHLLLLKIKAVKFNKSSTGTYITALLVTLVYCGLSSDITYKHKTDYIKEVDVYEVQKYNSSKTLLPIKDKTLKPKLNEEQREDRFEKLTTY